MKMYLKIRRFVNVLLISSFVRGQNETETCIKLKNVKWICKKASDCLHADLLFSTNQTFPCSNDKSTQRICCPQLLNAKSFPEKAAVTNKSSDQLRIDPKTIAQQKCEEYARYRFVNETIESQLVGEPPIFSQIRDCKAIEPLIVGGAEADEKEFPHMALIGFGDQISQINWVCGGSLISDQYILSAAHCTNNGPLDVVKWVMLGLLSKRDATDDKLKCNIFRIVEHFTHPDYHPPKENNDIALYKLEAPITLSPVIRPVCLYTSEELPTIDEKRVSITGWGRTDAAEDNSETLLKATINLLDDEVCKSTYKSESKFKNGFESKSMICAGHLSEAKDTCQGDSGGPLQIRQVGEEFECMWSQVGITSIGSAFCGGNIPSVYTSVAHYVPWIQSIVWPS